MNATRDCFGVIPPKKYPSHVHIKFVDEYGWTTDENGVTTYGVTGKIDLDAEINSPENRSLAGMEAIKEALAAGKLTLAGVADDGKHSADVDDNLADPNTAYMAYKQALAIQEKAKADLAAKGYDVDALANAGTAEDVAIALASSGHGETVSAAKGE